VILRARISSAFVATAAVRAEMAEGSKTGIYLLEVE